MSENPFSPKKCLSCKEPLTFTSLIKEDKKNMVYKFRCEACGKRYIQNKGSDALWSDTGV